jgi:hypothetical protein
MSNMQQLIALALTKLWQRDDDGRLVRDNPKMAIAELEGYGLATRWSNALEAVGIREIRQLPSIVSIEVPSFREGGETALIEALQRFLDDDPIRVLDKCDVLPIPLRDHEREVFRKAAESRGLTLTTFAIEAMREACK